MIEYAVSQTSLFLLIPTIAGIVAFGILMYKESHLAYVLCSLIVVCVSVLLFMSIGDDTKKAWEQNVQNEIDSTVCKNLQNLHSEYKEYPIIQKKIQSK